MSEDKEFTTSITLLAKLANQQNEGAWERFVEIYSPHVNRWCKKFGLQENDASDVTQDVLLKLLNAMQEFDYSPSKGSFRGWLKTVTSNMIRDLKKSAKRRDDGSGDTKVMQQIANISDASAFDQLAKLVETQYESELLMIATNKVKQRVADQTWKAYELNAVDQVPAKEVALELNIPISEVYVSKSRVIKMLREEIAKIDEG